MRTSEAHGRTAVTVRDYSRTSMRASAAAARRLDVRVVPRGRRLRGLDGCGPAADGAAPHARAPLPAPEVTLTSDEKQVWAKLPPDRSAIPVLALPRDRAGERLLERRGRFLRHRRRGLRQADDGDPARRLRDGRPADVPRLREREAGRSPSAAAAAHLRRRAGRLVDGRRRHPARAGLQRGHVRRRRACRRRRSRVPHLAGARDRAGQRPLAAAAPLRQGPHADPATARVPTTTGRSTPTRSRARTSTAGGSGCGRTSSGARRRSPITSPPTGRSPSRRRTAATARTAPTTRGSPTISSAGSRTATTPIFTQDVNARARAGERSAARPHPGDARDHRRRPARPSSHRPLVNQAGKPTEWVSVNAEDALGSHLAAHPALVEAAERGAVVEPRRVVGVDERRAGPQTRGDGIGVLGVGRPDRRAQPGPGVVGLADRVLLVVEGDDRQRRPELLLGDDPRSRGADRGRARAAGTGRRRDRRRRGRSRAREPRRRRCAPRRRARRRSRAGAGCAAAPSSRRGRGPRPSRTLSSSAVSPSTTSS